MEGCFVNLGAALAWCAFDNFCANTVGYCYASSSGVSRFPRLETGKAWSQAPECGDDAACSRLRSHCEALVSMDILR